MGREDKNCLLASKRCFPDLLPLGDTEMSGSSRSSIPKWIFRFRFLIQIYLPSPYALRWRSLPLNCLIYLQQSLWLILKGCRQRKTSEEDSSLSATHLITERSKWPSHSPADGKGGCEEGGCKRYEWRRESVDPEEPHDRPKTSGSSQACLFTHLTTHSFIYSPLSLYPTLFCCPTQQLPHIQQQILPGASTRDPTHDKVMRRRPDKQGISGFQGFRKAAPALTLKMISVFLMLALIGYSLISVTQEEGLPRFLFK